MRTIISATVANDRTLKATYKEEDKRRKNYEVTSNAIVHEDLLNAFNLLIPHAIAMCGFRDEPDMFTMTGFKIHEKETELGLTMHGYRKSGKRVFNFNVPYMPIDKGEYEQESELSKVIDVLIAEVNAYLFSDKWTAKQAELPIDAESSEESQLALSGGQ